MSNHYTYILKGLDCANCADKIELSLNKDSRFKNAIVNFSTSKLYFESSEPDISKKINKIVKDINPEATVVDIKKEINNEYKLNKFALIRLIIGILLGLSTLFFNYSELISTIVILASYIILLYKTAIKAFKMLFKSFRFDENILITISVIGAFLINEPFEGFMVIALYDIGKLLEELAVNKSRKSVKELMDIKPEFANIKDVEKITQIDPSEVKTDDIIVVKVGEKIPLDGIIVSGDTSLDTSALTGESKPRSAQNGEPVLSGSINLSNLIEIKVTALYKDSTVNKILELVENASNRKAKTENFVSKAARVYTPIIMILALSTGIFLPIFTSLSYNDSIYRALSFLVISCPCAIAISVPLSYFAGIGLSSKKGILVKGSDYLDNLRNIKTIVFDKTGTLTTGNFNVYSVISLSKRYSKEELLKIAAFGENYSNHPIAKSIVAYYGKEIKGDEILDYEEIAGKGISYTYENKKITIGNFRKIQISEDSSEDGTTIYVEIDNNVVGKIILKDAIKPKSKETIKELKKMGIKTIMLTGDEKQVADSVAKELGIIEYSHSLLPADKYEKLEKLLKSRTNNDKIAFVGDGINDAPVLTLADIGISMGMLGSSSAIEASDVVLMTDEVDKVLTAIKVSKDTTFIIKETLIFAIGTKLLFIILNMFGLTTMFWAVFADVGVTVLAILNSIRILKK